MKATVKKAELTGPGSYWNRSPHAISAIRAIRQTKQTRNKLTTKKHRHKQTKKQARLAGLCAWRLARFAWRIAGYGGVLLEAWSRLFIGWPLYWKLARMLVGRVLGHLVVWLVSSPNNTLSAAIDSNMESENQFKCDNANKKQQI